MHKMKSAAGILLAGLLLWGCGEKDADLGDEMTVEAAEAVTSELEVQKDGSIVETLVEDFGKDYYTEDTLKNMILAEVAEFNGSHGEAQVSVGKLEQKNGEVTLQMVYPSAEIYSAYNTDEYNNKSLFCGTVAEADRAGFSLDVTLQDTKGEKTVGKEELLEMGEQYILISENPMLVKVAGKIQYVSSNVTVSGRSEARLSGEDGAGDKYYIVYK